MLFVQLLTGKSIHGNMSEDNIEKNTREKLKLFDITNMDS